MTFINHEYSIKSIKSPFRKLVFHFFIAEKLRFNKPGWRTVASLMSEHPESK